MCMCMLPIGRRGGKEHATFHFLERACTVNFCSFENGQGQHHTPGSLFAKSANAGVVILFPKVARWSSRLSFSNTRGKRLATISFFGRAFWRVGRTRNATRQAHPQRFSLFFLLLVLFLFACLLLFAQGYACTQSFNGASLPVFLLRSPMGPTVQAALGDEKKVEGWGG